MSSRRCISDGLCESYGTSRISKKFSKCAEFENFNIRDFRNAWSNKPALTAFLNQTFLNCHASRVLKATKRQKKDSKTEWQGALHSCN